MMLAGHLEIDLQLDDVNALLDQLADVILCLWRFGAVRQAENEVEEFTKLLSPRVPRCCTAICCRAHSSQC